MSGPSLRPFGSAGKPLASLSDAELQLEVQTRRARRHGGGGIMHASQVGDASPADAAPLPLTRQARQWLANLELDDNANLADVDHAYARLVARYAPAADTSDGERRATARALLASLKKAHEGLRLYFSRVR